MKAETPRILNALRQFDIRVARTALVDSAEDAVAFAGRRDAPDPRIVSIALFDVTHPSKGTLVERRLDSAQAIRDAYDRMKQHGAQHIMAQAPGDARGELVEIRGETDSVSGQRTLSLSHDEHAATRTMPLRSADAEEMAAGYKEYGHEGKREAERRMLAHLLQRVARFFEATHVRQFQMNVRLQANHYTVEDAASTPLPHVLEREALHEHDHSLR